MVCSRFHVILNNFFIIRSGLTKKNLEKIHKLAKFLNIFVYMFPRIFHIFLLLGRTFEILK